MRTLFIHEDITVQSRGLWRWLKPLLLIVLCAAWILPGLVGHEPWKADEAYSFGLVYHMLQTGDWVVPTLGGEPFMEKPPLYFLTAALFGKLFSPQLSLPDAARMASGFYMALTFLFTGLAGRELFGRGSGGIAVLSLLSCFGLLLPAHQLLTDTAMLSGLAMGFYGLALSRRHRVIAGVLLGTGAGIGFMSKGVLAPGVLAATAIVLPLFSVWRTRHYATCLMLAVIAALPWLLVWPLALYQRSPELFTEWFWVNNFGRFFGFAKLGPTGESFFYAKNLPWISWPTILFAAWTIWRNKINCLFRQELQLPLVFLLVLFVVLTAAADARGLYALPLLLPLAVLASGELLALPRRFATGFYWLGVALFSTAAIAVWLAWVAVDLGTPALLAAKMNAHQPGYMPVLQPAMMAVAAGYTVAWIVLVPIVRHAWERAVISWAGGITLVWGLAATLLLSWVDTGMSYRSMFASMQQALPHQYTCVASHGLGEPQRGLLEYYAHIISRREKGTGQSECDVLFWQGSAHDKAPQPAGEWHLLWEGARPGDSKERFWLFGRGATVGGQSEANGP
jgi:4-amino-4-deoxy-L-arabinose transferase-like glycosyltransferase